MEITIQHFNDCPNWLEAAEHVQRAVDHVDTDVTVRLEIVNTPQRAEEVRFRGSPTILIDGTDPFAEPDAPVGLSCRIYTTPSGIAGSPTTEQLVDLLTKSRAEDSSERSDDDG
ncbi:MAG: thioredoxin family protein [Actinobacteria bacterium]|nr:MAG: thioredoxin family protein [Actinomycetota bacterium]